MAAAWWVGMGGPSCRMVGGNGRTQLPHGGWEWEDPAAAWWVGMGDPFLHVGAGNLVVQMHFIRKWLQFFHELLYILYTDSVIRDKSGVILYSQLLGKQVGRKCKIEKLASAFAFCN